MEKIRKEKLLYIMGVDWGWIFQRPQIIEQHLEKKYDVTVVFPRSILNFFFKSSVPYPASYKILWTIPLQEKNWLIGQISKLLNRHIFSKVNSYQMIVIGYPLYYRYIPDYYSGFLVYDCMDNHEALYTYPAGVAKLLWQEKRLIRQCDLLFVSSQMLAEKMQNYGIVPMPPTVLLRNGTEIPEIMPPVSFSMRRKFTVIGYFGTIAEWFDAELLLESLKQFEDIEYHLIGPINISLPRHSRLIPEGVVQHEFLYETVQSYSCLIMPFRLEETVLYVDPVKLYEYIVMGKCIIAVYYPEIKRFEDFVYFYHSHSEYIQLLSVLKAKGFPPKYNSTQRYSFLVQNSWAARFEHWDKSVQDVNQIKNMT